MNWVKKRKLSAIKAIKYNRCPFLEPDDLWQAFYESFNLAQHWQVNTALLEEIPNKSITSWSPFSKEEFLLFINKCNNALTPRLDKLSWRHFKVIIHNLSCLKNFINITNACINLGHWLSHFKMSTSIIIPKSNKASYNTSKDVQANCSFEYTWKIN